MSPSYRFEVKSVNTSVKNVPGIRPSLKNDSQRDNTLKGLTTHCMFNPVIIINRTINESIKSIKSQSADSRFLMFQLNLTQHCSEVWVLTAAR